MSKSINFFGILFFVLFLVSCVEDSDIINPQDDRDAFLGTWNVDETCLRLPYQVTIVKDPTNSSQVIITNFWLMGPGEKAPYAIVAGSHIEIPQQNIFNDGNTIVKGSGELIKKKIDWVYSINDGADLYSCTATYEEI